MGPRLPRTAPCASGPVVFWPHKPGFGAALGAGFSVRSGAVGAAKKPLRISLCGSYSSHPEARAGLIRLNSAAREGGAGSIDHLSLQVECTSMETTDPHWTPTTPSDLASLDQAPILSRYEILEEIGRGGMGVVHRGRHRLLDQQVAIKFCLPGREIERFLREAKLLATVRSPHVVPVRDFDLL